VPSLDVEKPRLLGGAGMNARRLVLFGLSSASFTRSRISARFTDVFPADFAKDPV